MLALPVVLKDSEYARADSTLRGTREQCSPLRSDANHHALQAPGWALRECVGLNCKLRVSAFFCSECGRHWLSNWPLSKDSECPLPAQSALWKNLVVMLSNLPPRAPTSHSSTQINLPLLPPGQLLLPPLPAADAMSPTAVLSWGPGQHGRRHCRRRQQ